MTFKGSVYPAHAAALLFVLVAVLPAPGLGQSRKAGRHRGPSSPATGPAGEASHGEKKNNEKSEPPAAMEQLRAEMAALHALVEQQQRAMADMQKRLEAMQVRERSPEAIPASTLGPDQTARRAAAAEVQQNHESPPAGKTPASAAPGGAKTRAQEKQGLVAGWDDNHAFIRSADGSFETDLTGYAQLDFRGYESGIHPPNTFLVRRARMAMEGRLHRYFEWRIEGDFADTSNTPLRDFYVNIHRVDAFQLRFGQTREPFSQEEMRSDNLQEFVERSLVNNLAPSRAPGIMAYGSLGKGVFEYQVGVFNGKGLLQNNNNGTPDQALRLRFNPWKGSRSPWTKGLIFGGAYNQGRNLNGTSIRGLTESRITYFQPETVNGKLYRANGELTWLLGPATLRAEYDQTNQKRDNLGPNGTNLPGVISKGYMAQFTYMLTGESKPDVGTVTPARNLFDREGGGRTGLGAWELKARYDNLLINDGGPKSNRADTVYFGANWYMTKFIRYMLDVGIERFKDPKRAPRPGENFLTVLSRVQLQF